MKPDQIAEREKAVPPRPWNLIIGRKYKSPKGEVYTAVNCGYGYIWLKNDKGVVKEVRALTVLEQYEDLDATQPAAAPAAVPDGWREVVVTLIDLAAAANTALDDSEERADDDGYRVHVLDGAGFDSICKQLDKLELLPDDMPGHTLGPAGKAEWALRYLLGTAMLAAAPVDDKRDAERWKMMCGDWREELVALHGPKGHITSGLTMDQARAIIDAHGGIDAAIAAQKPLAQKGED